MLSLAAILAGVNRPQTMPSPQRYLCPRTLTPTLTGKGDDPAWQAAQWSADFVDILGDKKPKPTYRTRLKMIHDGQALYIHAHLEEPHVWGTLTEKNSIIFRDNDFEIFIDPDSDSRNYYEYEVNALGTIMELTMDKPYSQGGNYTMGTNLPGLVSKVFVDGTVNDPTDVDKFWSVDVKLPFADLARYCDRTACPPNKGDAWRINFSRVQWSHEVVDGKYVKIPHEKKPEDNWVWQPHNRVDMHRPEQWGYVEFG